MTLSTTSRMNSEDRQTKTNQQLMMDRRKSDPKLGNKAGNGETEENNNEQKGYGDGSESIMTSQSKEGLEPKGNIPLVRIQRATPSPRPPSQLEESETARKSKRRKKTEEGEEAIDEDDEDDEEEDDDEEEEDVEEEEEDTDMTQEEKQAMYEAVMEGDIDVLEDCLDLPNADINMIWFQENLLMAAIRAGHVDVCEFLLDNGVDYTFTTSVMDVRDTPTGKIMERYEVNCRQMAYDRDLQGIVFLIDVLQDNLFPFIPRPLRTPRLRRPKQESSTNTEDEDADGSYSDVSETSVDSEKIEEGVKGSDGESPTTEDKETRHKKKRKRLRKKRQSRVSSATQDEGIKGDASDGDDDDDGKRTTTIDDEDGDKDKTFRTGSTCGDVDSGNYSMASSKLRKSLLQKHDRLFEKEEGSASTSLDSPRKSETGSAQTKSQSKRSKGDKTDRTSTTFTQDEGRSTSVPAESEVPVESLVPEIPAWASAFNPPTNKIRSTKAVVAARQGNLARNFYKSPLHVSTTERPLQWRKVSTSGSYTRESRRWHLEKKIEEAANEQVQISRLQLTPFTSSSSNSPAMVSQTGSISFKSPKSQSLSSNSTPSELSDLQSLSSLSLSERLDNLKSQKTNSKNGNQSGNPASKLASYMRPTKSTITKQRLGPQFVDTYGGLDFCPTPIKSSDFKTGILKTSMRPGVSGSLTIGAFSRSHKVPVLNVKAGLQRRNENVISYRI